MKFSPGDRVRIMRPESEYTGCRGTIVPDPSSHPADVAPLGYYVAIDGENGMSRPFLLQDLAPLRPAFVRPAKSPADAESGGSR